MYGVLPSAVVTSLIGTPVRARAPITTAVELASLGLPGLYPQPPSSFCTDFSQSAPLSAASRCWPSSTKAWTAAAVALVSITVDASQGAEASSRYEVKAPLSHCCSSSQSTDCFDGVTYSIFWARKASDCRHTPSYVGSVVP